MKHIEMCYDSLAECCAKLRESDLITISDLGHKAKVVIDIDRDSPFDGSYIKVPDTSHTIWHKASEDVGNNRKILVINDKGMGSITDREHLVRGYGEWGKGFVKWVYVDELLKATNGE